MEKMAVVVFAETGHVLGALTRTADPEGALEPADIVGDALLIRDPDTGDRLLNVPARHLGVEIVDRVQQVLLAPRPFVLVDGLPDEPSEITGGASPVAHDGTKLTVTLVPLPPEDIEVWVQLEAPREEPVLRRVAIPATGTSSENFTLTPGGYAVLLLAPGYQTFIGHVAVP
ncbi:MAG: hypothetical protein GY906_13930 [bacterium]|nr:hypothetical protein [bacterium]